jgi:hypothetical protein
VQLPWVTRARPSRKKTVLCFSFVVPSLSNAPHAWVIYSVPYVLEVIRRVRWERKRVLAEAERDRATRRELVGRTTEAGQCAPITHLPSDSGQCAPITRLPSDSGQCAPITRLPSGSGQCAPITRLPSDSGQCAPITRLPSDSRQCAPITRLPSDSRQCAPITRLPKLFTIMQFTITIRVVWCKV